MSEEVYCICGLKYDDTKFMIQCDICKDWLHGRCVNLTEDQCLDIEKYHCPRCEPMCGSSIYKQRTSWHRHDPYEADADFLPVQCGTETFVQQLTCRQFRSGDEVVERLRGHQFTLLYLAEHGWTRPLLFDSTDGLDIVVPAAGDFSVSDVENYIGSERMLDVIDVNRQCDVRMSMHQLCCYFMSFQRDVIYNCISLEFSNTSLACLVDPPRTVRRMCWLTNLWPPELDVQLQVQRPQVSKYCLLSAARSYTDFHIDFGGTSVWYHVLKGSKTFYLVQPSSTNLSLYERWMSSSSRSATFFGDQVDACYQLSVKSGDTLLIPGGWIHAVYTPQDSIVFGGNFLCSMHVPMQLRIHELEQRLRTPRRLCLSAVQTCHWLGAARVARELRELLDSNRHCAVYLVTAARALHAALRHWVHIGSLTRRSSTVEPVPPNINGGRLIKLLATVLRHVDRLSGGGGATATAHVPALTDAALAPDTAAATVSRRSARTRRQRPVSRDFVDISERADFESLLVQAECDAPHSDRRSRVPDGPGLSVRRVGDKQRSSAGVLTIDESRGRAVTTSRAEKAPLKLRLSLGGAMCSQSVLPVVVGENRTAHDQAVVVAQHSDVSDHCSSPDTRDAVVGMLTMAGQRTTAPARSSLSRRVVTSESECEHDQAPPYTSSAHDDEFVYPTLDTSSDEDMDSRRRARRGGGKHLVAGRQRRRRGHQDLPWNPSSHVTLAGSTGAGDGRRARLARDGARRLAVSEAIGRTAAKQQQQHASSHNTQLCGGRSLSGATSHLHSTLTYDSTTATKRCAKPKKGMLTAKQRLGRILKMHKMKF